MGRFLAVILVMCWGAVAQAQELTGLAWVDADGSALRDVEGGTELVLALSQPVPWRVFTLDAPRRLVPWLTRHRAITLIVLINLPGNTLLGGGGGIALVTGLSKLMPVKQFLALYIGGMGARDKNFYNDYAKRLGYEAEAKIIQDLYLDGKKAEAAANVPDKLCDEIALLGSADRVRDRLQAWKEAAKNNQITAMLAAGIRPEGMRVLAEELL